MAKDCRLPHSKALKKSISKKNRRRSDMEMQFLLPCLLTKRAYLAMRSIVPRDFQRRMRYYYDDHGCLRCGFHRGPHKANGFCLRCCSLVTTRLKRCHDRRKNRKQSRYAQDLLSKGHQAKALLKDLLQWKGSDPTVIRTKTLISKNPALETFDRLRE
jgi:hypothetical protein